MQDTSNSIFVVSLWCRVFRFGGLDGTKIPAGSFGMQAEAQSWSWWVDHGEVDELRKKIAVQAWGWGKTWQLKWFIVLSDFTSRENPLAVGFASCAELILSVCGNGKFWYHLQSCKSCDDVSGSSCAIVSLDAMWAVNALFWFSDARRRSWVTWSQPLLETERCSSSSLDMDESRCNKGLGELRPGWQIPWTEYHGHVCIYVERSKGPCKEL